MAKYYVFHNENSFSTVNTKISAIHLRQDGIMFKHVEGISNPWFCYHILPDGSYELENGKKKIYKPSEVNLALKKFFYHTEESLLSDL